jgi:uncharacterized membrane protein YgdD (TMEM256/DUF423 family)
LSKIDVTLLKRLAIPCVLAGLSVLTGAFGAHYLRETLLLPARQLEVWGTGVQYLFYHALGLGFLALVYHLIADRRILLARRLMLSGTLVFSLSLFLVALHPVLPFATRWLGMITPFGGVLMIAGWALAGYVLWKLGKGWAPKP